MSKAWLNGGKVVFSGGKVILCATCPCGVTPGEECTDCSPSVTPAQQLAQVSGAVDGTCGDCEFWNTTAFILDQDEGINPCTWQFISGDMGWSCEPGGSGNVILQISGGNVTATINLPGGGAVIYQKSSSGIDCASIGDIPFSSAVGPGAAKCDWSSSVINIQGV